MESSLPNTPDPFLVELAEESTYAYQMTYARLPGGESDTDGQVTWYRSGVSGEFFNGILRASFAEERLDESIQGALAPFRSRNLSMRWYIGPSSQPPGLEQGLIRCGMRFSWSGPALAAALDDLRAPEKRAEGLACERVEGQVALAEWIDLWLGSAPPEAQQRLKWVYTVSDYGKALELCLYLGRVDGRAVATACVYYGCRAAAVKHVTTMPAFQRRGIASMLTLFALDDAREHGCRYAALTSSPEGYPVYRRLGFKEVCRFTRYIWAP